MTNIETIPLSECFFYHNEPGSTTDPECMVDVFDLVEWKHYKDMDLVGVGDGPYHWARVMGTKVEYDANSNPFESEGNVKEFKPTHVIWLGR